MGAPPLLLGGRLSHKGKRGVIANVPRDVTSPVCLLNGARFSTGPFSKGAPLPGATPIAGTKVKNAREKMPLPRSRVPCGLCRCLCWCRGTRSPAYQMFVSTDRGFEPWSWLSCVRKLLTMTLDHMCGLTWRHTKASCACGTPVKSYVSPRGRCNTLLCVADGRRMENKDDGEDDETCAHTARPAQLSRHPQKQNGTSLCLSLSRPLMCLCDFPK